MRRERSLGESGRPPGWKPEASAKGSASGRCVRVALRPPARDHRRGAEPHGHEGGVPLQQPAPGGVGAQATHRFSRGRARARGAGSTTLVVAWSPMRPPPAGCSRPRSFTLFFGSSTSPSPARQLAEAGDERRLLGRARPRADRRAAHRAAPHRIAEAVGRVVRPREPAVSSRGRSYARAIVTAWPGRPAGHRNLSLRSWLFGYAIYERIRKQLRLAAITIYETSGNFRGLS